MNKKISRILTGFLFLISAISLFVVVLIKTGNLYVGMSAYSHYRLSEAETELVEGWMSRFHKNVENGDFDEIRKELVKNRQSVETQNSVLKNAKFAFDKYGKIEFSKFFRSALPEPAARFYGKDLKGNVYGLFYHSNAERGTLSESYELVINDNEVNLLRYSGDEIKDWEIRENNGERWLEQNLPNEARIPYGARFIEIRY